MHWWRLYGAGLGVGCLVLAAWYYGTKADQGVVMYFAPQVASASVLRPSADVFTVTDARVGGTAMPAIAASDGSRIAWDVTVPAGAWVEAHVALPESMAAGTADGVLFRIGVSFDDRYEEVVTHVMKPFPSPELHQWTPVAADLSAYAGRRVSLIFNTGGPGLWGGPRLVVR